MPAYTTTQGQCTSGDSFRIVLPSTTQTVSVTPTEELSPLNGRLARTPVKVTRCASRHTVHDSGTVLFVIA